MRFFCYQCLSGREAPAKDEPLTLQQLLERVKEGRVTDNSANKRERQLLMRQQA